MELGQYTTMTFDGVSLRYHGNSGPACFLADLFDFVDVQVSTGDTRNKMAHTLQMADKIDFGDTAYTGRQLEGGANRQLSRYVIEHSYYARKLFKLYGFLWHRNPTDLEAGPVANLCEELVGLHNFLFSQLLPRSPYESPERIRECVCAYVDCTNRIMTAFWEDPNNNERTFTCSDVRTGGFEVSVNTSTANGTYVQGVVMRHRIASNGSGGPVVFTWENIED